MRQEYSSSIRCGWQPKSSSGHCYSACLQHGPSHGLGSSLYFASRPSAAADLYRFLDMRFFWHESYKPYKHIGSDTVMTVSPTGNVVWTCDPDVVSQVFTRRLDFPKSVDVMQILNVFGPTLTAAEGPEASLYRKVAAPAFSDETHHRVWKYTLESCGQLVEHWLQHECIHDLGSYSSELTLRVLSFGSYGQTTRWSFEQDPALKNGHTMTYREAIASFLEQAIIVFLTPEWVLSEPGLAP